MCPISVPDCYWDVCCWWSDSWRSLRLRGDWTFVLRSALTVFACSILLSMFLITSAFVLTKLASSSISASVLPSRALVLRSALSGFGTPFRLACAPSASFGTLCGDMQSSVGHQGTVCASPPSLSFTRWRHLRTGTLTIIALADATLTFAMKNRVVTAANSTVFIFFETYCSCNW